MKNKFNCLTYPIGVYCEQEKKFRATVECYDDKGEFNGYYWGWPLFKTREEARQHALNYLDGLCDSLGEPPF